MTRAQRETLDNIRAFVTAHGRPPTIRELKAIEGLKSTAGIHSRLRALVRDGYLRELDDCHGRYVPADHHDGADLRTCSTEELQAELARRGQLAAAMTTMARVA